MPLPWKKNSKINRGVSRFVNDIRASKRGESLVVQTGFPTSLIDLIVKNRNRFNKHRSFIESAQIIPNQCPAPGKAPSPAIAPAMAPILNSLYTLRDNDDSENRLILNLNGDVTLLEDDDAEKICESGKEICVLNVEYERNQDGDVNEGLIGKNMVVIRVFLVLILAVATKKIAMAMTLVVFLLMFLEKLLNLCVSGCRRWMVPRKLGERERERVRLIEVEESIVVSNFIDFREEFNGMIRGSLGRKIDVIDDLANDERERECIFSDLAGGIEVSKECEPPVLGRRESAKLKAKKFKRYVAKKFGGESRKRRRNKQRTPDQCFAQSTGSNTEESLTSGDTDEENNDEEDIADSLIEMSKPCLDTGVLGCLGRTQNWSWSTCIPIMIVLVALVGGRTMALVLSIVCILLHKLYGGT